jgi:hypothetical protein
MEERTMITAQFTLQEIRSLIQSLESERDQYVKEYASCRLDVLRTVAERVVKENNRLIGKLEALASGVLN